MLDSYQGSLWRTREIFSDFHTPLVVEVELKVRYVLRTHQRCLGYKTTRPINTLRPRQNGRHFADDMFKCIFLNENVWIPIEISLKFVPRGSFNNNPALFQIMAWRRPGDKPLSERMLVSSLTHICVTRLQWVKKIYFRLSWLNSLTPGDSYTRE